MNLRTKTDKIKITVTCKLKCKAFFVFFLLFIGFASNAQEQIMTVIAEGSGTTKNEAIRDAMQDAIRKAVGSYVVSHRRYQSQVSNDKTQEHYTEELYDVSDAHINTYTVLNTKWNNGIFTVKIQAKVVPNEYLKYVPKHIVEELTQREIGNMQNTQNMLQQSRGIIKEIFKDYWLYLYTLKLDVEQAQPEDIDKNGIITAWRVPITAAVNQNAFMQLHQRLSQFLGKICRAKCSVYVRDGEDFPKGLGDMLWKRAGLKGDLDDNNYVFICLKVVQPKGKHYSLYLIPKLIRSMICDEVLSTKWLLMVTLSPKDTNAKPLRSSFKIFFSVHDRYFWHCKGSSEDWLKIGDSWPWVLTLQNEIYDITGFDYKDNMWRRMETLSIPLGDKDYEIVVYPMPIPDSSTDKWESLAAETEKNLRKIKEKNLLTKNNSVTMNSGADQITVENELVQYPIIEEPILKKCWYCSGKKMVKCTNCSNGRCRNCRGRGTKPWSRPNLSTRSWETYYEQCKDCGGSGACNNACQNGKVRCRKCKGTGYLQPK